MKTRKRLVVMKKFQAWFMFRFIIYTASLLLLFGGGVLFWFKTVADTVFKLAALLKDSFVTVINMNAKMGVVVFVALSVFMLGIAIFEAFVFSRKIAGPLFAFLRHLKKCEEKGRLEKIRLRDGDLFVDLQENFNRMVEKINGQKSNKANQIRLIPFHAPTTQRRKANAH